MGRMRILPVPFSNDVECHRAMETSRAMTQSWRSAFLLLIGATSTFLRGPFAHAESPENSTVVIVADEATPITLRLQQELEALGFRVHLEAQEFSAPLDHLGQEIASGRATAAIEIKTKSPGVVSLLLLDPRTGRIVHRSLPIETPKDPTAAELVTTRTVELLRAARLQIKEIKPSEPPKLPPRVSREAGPPLAQSPDRKPSKLLLGAATELAISPGWSQSSDFLTTATWIWQYSFGLTMGVSVPVLPARIAGTRGSRIEVFPTTIRGGMLYNFTGEKAVGLLASGGIEVTDLRYAGQVSSPWVGTTAHLTSLAPWFAGTVRLGLSSRLRLVTAMVASYSTRRNVARFAGQELLPDWGRPMLSIALGMEWQAL